MSMLRRTLSLRWKKASSYNALPRSDEPFRTPREKISAIAEEKHGDTENSVYVSTKTQNAKFYPSTTRGRFTRLDSNTTSTPVNSGGTGGKENRSGERQKSKQQKSKVFPGMSTVKTALTSIGQKLKGKHTKRVVLRDSPSMFNNAYTTPRRSDRIKAKSTPSPLSLKMYSPFCIETPGKEHSFRSLSTKRKASTLAVNESPLTKTPRRMVRSAIKKHKQLAKSISSSHVVIPTASGY